MTALSRSDAPDRMPHACPACASESVVEGRIVSSGTDEGWAARFYPKGLRFFTFRRSVELASRQTFRACLACGHLWGQVGPSELRDLLAASGNERTVAAVKRARDDAGEASKLHF